MTNSKGYKENLYEKGCIRTFSGIYVDILNPKPEMFVIEDIAHALSQLPRFGGHLPVFYSVAEHSLCASNVGEKERFELLMHDASEAYILDIPSPLKKILKEYKEIEHNLNIVLSEVFRFQYPFSSYVHSLDKKMLEHEWEERMIKGLGKEKTFLSVEYAFLERYKLLKIFNT